MGAYVYALLRQINMHVTTTVSHKNEDINALDIQYVRIFCVKCMVILRMYWYVHNETKNMFIYKIANSSCILYLQDETCAVVLCTGMSARFLNV